MAISRDRMMSIGILIAIILLSILLESYSMAIEKEMFAVNYDIHLMSNGNLQNSELMQKKITA